jgi:hypothetical protein
MDGYCADARKGGLNAVQKRDSAKVRAAEVKRRVRTNGRAEYGYTRRSSPRVKRDTTDRVPWTVRYGAELADIRAPGSTRDRMAQNVRDEADLHGSGGTWTVHDALDSAGFAPGIGTASDVINGVVYASEGNWGSAALSLVAAVPLAGDILAAGRKGAREVEPFLDDIIRDGGKYADNLGELGTFAKSSYRKNLIKLTGGVKADSHAHHVLPQAFADKFKMAAIDINDPRLLTWWQKTDHLRMASAYNRRWQSNIRDLEEVGPITPGNRNEILQFGSDLMTEFGQSVGY